MQHRSRHSSARVAVLLLGLSAAASVTSITQYAAIYPFDVALALVAASAAPIHNKYVRRISLLFLFFAIYIYVVDTFIHEAEPLATLKYAGLHVLYLASFLGFFVLLRQGYWALIGVLLCLALAYALQAAFFGTAQRGDDIGWEMGFNMALVLVMIALACLTFEAQKWKLSLRMAIHVILTTTATATFVVALANLDRSVALLAFLVLAVVLFVRFAPQTIRHMIAKHPSLAVISGLAFGLAFVVGQVGLAWAGFLPPDVTRKIIDQWNHPYGYVVGARAESISAFLVGWQYPWFGIGTSSVDVEAIKIYVDIVAPSDIENVAQYYTRTETFVPLHSMLGGAWARTGLIGLVVWSVITIFILRASAKGLASSPSVATILLISGGYSIYQILFEPVADRYFLGLALAAAVMIEHKIAIGSLGGLTLTRSRGLDRLHSRVE